MTKYAQKYGLKAWRRRNQLAAARRRANVEAGLRCDGKPLAPRKPCGCLQGSCLKCARTENRLRFEAMVSAVYSEYEAGASFTSLELKYRKSRSSIRNWFERRDLKIRPAPMPKLGYGVKIPAATEAELTAMIANLTHLRVPDELKREWRSWPLAKRAAFVKRLREIFPSNRPTTPFIGVEPFEYGSPKAHEICHQANIGRNSRNKLIALKPCSEGVIWNGQLFFWDKTNDYVSGMGIRKNGPMRPLLKRVIYEQCVGPIPEKHIIIHADGNKNNFTPSNLVPLSMAENALRNSITVRIKRDPTNPELQAKSKLRAERMAATRARNQVRHSRVITASLLQSNGLIKAMSRRAA